MNDNFLIENKQSSPVRGAAAHADISRPTGQEISLEFYEILAHPLNLHMKQ